MDYSPRASYVVERQSKRGKRQPCRSQPIVSVSADGRRGVAENNERLLPNLLGRGTTRLKECHPRGLHELLHTNETDRLRQFIYSVHLQYIWLVFCLCTAACVCAE